MIKYVQQGTIELSGDLIRFFGIQPKAKAIEENEARPDPKEEPHQGMGSRQGQVQEGAMPGRKLDVLPLPVEDLDMGGMCRRPLSRYQGSKTRSFVRSQQLRDKSLGL